MSKAKRQTREQRADALLEAARMWQNGWPVFGTNAWCCPKVQEIIDVVPSEIDLNWESAALSEVAGLGFDIVNADGTPTEKVAILVFNFGAYSGWAWRSYLCNGTKRKVRK